VIIIMGSVGSGKTEQGTRLMKKFDCPRLSTSQLLRDHPDHKWHEHILAGKLVNDQDMINILQPELDRLEADKREFILDGAPRSIPQAQWMVREIKDKHIKLTAVINLVVGDDIVVKRLRMRGREDDQESIILKRLKDYHDITQPVLKYLEDSGIKVHDINGENDPETVEMEIDKILGI
jgi:adenylate kinase